MLLCVALVIFVLICVVEAQARIAFTSERDGNHDIYVMDADGGNPQNLTNNPANDRRPSWSPDGQRIIFSSLRDGNNDIYVMDADGGNPQNLTNHPALDWTPAWFRSAFAVTPAGKKLTIWGAIKATNHRNY